MHVSLSDGWTVCAVAGQIPAEIADIHIPATVPGCVHTDLLAAGLIPDPYLDSNEAALGWIGRVDWRYRTSFHWDETAVDDDDQIDLVALGLDTVATVELNGVTVARTQNMHRPYRFPVTRLLRAGPNELSVTFAAGLTAAERMSDEQGPRPYVSAHPFNAIRKMACNYGWDWGPDLVTAGIWRPLSIESWRGARIAAVRPMATVDGSTGVLNTHVEVQRAAGHDNGPLTVRVELSGSHTETVIGAGQTSVVVASSGVPDVARWWPQGYGDQPMYPVAVTLCSAGGVLDHREKRVGFRTVELDTRPDEHGTAFTLVVNGTPVFARGVNWIPDDCFPSRITRERYARRLTQARDAQANLVRVWGGGIYESEDFYDTCDELGLLVWQDFPFACAAYAEEEPLRGEVIAEARAAVTRISSHPSLALWNGGNETLWGYQDWGWEQPLAGRSWGAGYYFDVLPAIVAELDPATPYSPGSPWSPASGQHPNDPAHGTVHIWDVWNQLDYTAYRGYTPRFCAEFGFQGPPSWATLTRAVHDEPLAADSPGMLAHQKAQDGKGKLARGLHSHLPQPTSIQDWHWATSLNQARAVAFGLEHFRSLMPLCTGAIVWQFNDCWPVTSWSAVDGDGRRKPMWYALRRSFRDRLITLQPREEGLAAIIVNDSGLQWKATLELSRRSFDGVTVAETSIPFEVGPRAAVTLGVPADVATPRDPTREIVLAETGQDRAWWHFAEDIDSALPPADLDTTVDVQDGGYRLTITARSMVRDLALLVDRLDPDAEVDHMLVTMLPGDRVQFVVRTQASIDPQELTAPTVLRSANQLMHPAAAAVPVGVTTS